MNTIKFFKFFQENAVEWRWQENGDVEDVLAFIPLHELDTFTEMLSHSLLDEDGIEVNLKRDYVAIWLKDICDRMGFDAEEVFEKEHQQ